MITIVPASPAHIATIANRMRAIDALECLPRSPKDALRLSLRASSLAWTAKIDGRAEAMFGITPVSAMEGIGSPWLLMTDDAIRQGRALLVLGREYVERMSRLFPVLENRCHADNDAAICWLSRLGFCFEPMRVIDGQPMRPFSRGGDHL